MRINRFLEGTNERLRKGLELLSKKIIEKKVDILSSTTDIDSKLVTKNVDNDLWNIKWARKYVENPPPFIDIEPLDLEDMKAGLLIYKDELLKAQKIANTTELENEIKEVDRILELPIFKDVPKSVYEKYGDNLKETQGIMIPNEVDQLIDEIDNLNTLSKNSLGCKIFNNDAKLLNRLRVNATNEIEFLHRITTIASILGDIDVENIKKEIFEKNIVGSLNLIQKLFDEKGIKYDTESFKKLRLLINLRSTKQPIHNGEHKAIEILKELGIDYPINYMEAGEKCSRHLLDAIHSLNISMAEHRKN